MARKKKQKQLWAAPEIEAATWRLQAALRQEEAAYRRGAGRSERIERLLAARRTLDADGPRVLEAYRAFHGRAERAEGLIEATQRLDPEEALALVDDRLGAADGQLLRAVDAYFDVVDLIDHVMRGRDGEPGLN